LRKLSTAITKKKRERSYEGGDIHLDEQTIREAGRREKGTIQGTCQDPVIHDLLNETILLCDLFHESCGTRKGK